METRVPPFVVNCSNLHKIFVIPNKNLRRVFNDYSFLYIPDEKTIDQNIYDEIKKSKIIIMDHYSELNRSSNDIYFIICINKMILIIKNSKSFDQLFLEIKSEKEIYFLSDTKDILGENIQYFESKKNQYLDEEISNFNEQIEILKSTTFPICFCKSIRSCITTYLIEQSYSKLNNDRIQLFYSNQIEKITPKTINDDEYIELRSIGSGSSCHVYLIYHIIDEKLLVIKKIQQENLYEREKNNYLNMNHPFIPKFYGFNSNKCSLFIEYINGKTLLDINMLELSEKDSISFILQLLRVFSYLHSNNFIYRDLKPNNVMIDQNKTIVLIDFDQMIKDDNDGEHTINFNSVYIAPEIFENKLTKKSDIFSIGQLIYYFKKNKHPNKVLSNNLYGYPIIDKFYEQLTKMNPEERPDISEFINDFHIYALAKNQIIDRIDREDHYLLGLMCKQFCEKNDTKYINKAIQYLQFAANLNHPISLFLLGVLYYEGKYISNNISNAIYYFSLAAKQNITDAYHNLGLIYYENKYVKRDINKAIYNFNIASNNNHAQSQYNLGFIYYKGQYIKQDIEKAINYFSLAAEQKDVQAQYNLGLIYSNGKYVKQDMDKAIYYFKLASDQNHPISQNKLGSLYYIGQYVEQNINTAINLFSLSAKQNYPESQFMLGCFYLDGKYVEKNINKAIDLLTRAANQNCVLAQNTLGSIYLRSDYVIQDINNAIYYLSLAANQNHPDAQYQL